MNRFSSVSHLDSWKRTGAFPEIHLPLCTFVAENASGVRMLDLCACYGLLGARLKRLIGVDVWAVEGNPSFIAAAQAAGVPVAMIQLRITRDTLPQLADIITGNRIQTVVARRALPELWGNDLEGGMVFAEMLRNCGVEEVFIEGRVKTPGAVNSLPTVAEEIKLLSPSFTPRVKRGALAMLA